VFKVGTNHLALPQYTWMRVDQYFDLDLHFLIFSIVPAALLALYIAVKLLLFFIRLPFRLLKRTSVVADEKKQKVE
jgi:hypothetical protein